MYWPLAAATGELGSLTWDGRKLAASSAKITGIAAFSQKLCTICWGEYESMAAPWRLASAILRASDPGRWMVSASVKSSHWPRATLTPAVTALFLPVQSAGSGPASKTRTRASFGELKNEEAIWRVRSVE